MKKSRFSEAQIIGILKEHKGRPVGCGTSASMSTCSRPCSMPAI